MLNATCMNKIPQNLISRFLGLLWDKFGHKLVSAMKKVEIEENVPKV